MIGGQAMFSFQIPEGDKETRYQQILKQCYALLEEEDDWLANLANTASHLYHTLGDVNWVGYYLMKNNQLVLGPFMGKPACVRIPIGKGVCGTAVLQEKVQLVPDVHQFPEHIACDAASQSEIVIPLKVNNQLLGVLDIDSPIKSRFDEIDQKYLEQFCSILIKHTNWAPLLGSK